MGPTCPGLTVPTLKDLAPNALTRGGSVSAPLLISKTPDDLGRVVMRKIALSLVALSALATSACSATVSASSGEPFTVSWSIATVSTPDISGQYRETLDVDVTGPADGVLWDVTYQVSGKALAGGASGVVNGTVRVNNGQPTNEFGKVDHSDKITVTTSDPTKALYVGFVTAKKVP